MSLKVTYEKLFLRIFCGNFDNNYKNENFFLQNLRISLEIFRYFSETCNYSEKTIVSLESYKN